MLRHFVLLLVLGLAFPALARDKQENWLEVRSEHFTVFTNANEKTGRHVADQFERMRAVFHTLYPSIPIDRVGPIVVLAVKDENDFRTLEPEAYLAKGSAKLGGLFLRAPDKNYVLLRLNAEGEHPYSVIYHEYTHLLLGKAGDWIPLWLNEGLAQFYENTDIHDKEAWLGQPSQGNLILLSQNRLLPLSSLFTVDYNSPYYHEENKTSIFYAESWALMHYIMVTDLQQKTQRSMDYLKLVAQNVDPVTAGTRAFGDLNQLQKALEAYIHNGNCNKYFRLPFSVTIDDAAFKVQAITPSQADAVRADFLAYDRRTNDASALLDRILKDDPNNVLAHETKGYLAFHDGHMNEARTWYEQAVKLDSQSYLAHYYFAAISMNMPSSADDAAVEKSLRTAIKLEPSFAPPYERLASFLAAHHGNLQDAYSLSLAAVQMDPGNVHYRMASANILMEMDRPKDAVAVLRNALKAAKTPEDSSDVQNMLSHVEEFNSEREKQKAFNAKADADWKKGQTDAAAAAQIEKISKAQDEPAPKGAHHVLLGKLEDVSCQDSRIELTLQAKNKSIALHNPNYFKVQYSALGFTPKGDLNPCHDLEGSTAMVDYVEMPDKPGSAYVFGIEVHK